jgi:hypothetical protein
VPIGKKVSTTNGNHSSLSTLELKASGDTPKEIRIMYDQSAESWERGDAVFHLANTNKLPNEWEIAVSYVVNDGEDEPTLADGYRCSNEDKAIHYPNAFRTFEQAEARVEAERKEYAEYKKSRDGRIEKMALTHFDEIETLCWRYCSSYREDDEDVKAVSVCDIFTALKAAYEMGWREATARPRVKKPSGKKAIAQ